MSFYQIEPISLIYYLSLNIDITVFKSSELGALVYIRGHWKINLFKIPEL